MQQNVSSVTTLPFTVTVGTPFFLETINDYFPTSHQVYGGEFFSVTPKVRLLDKGGNLVWQDSTSAVSISLFDNPTGAVLGLPESLFPTAENGVVQFRNLLIDRVGDNYTFLFRLYNYSSLTNEFYYTGISSISERFSVVQGSPRKLVLHAKADRAWAGKQAFSFQPIVHLTDYGGNIVVTNASQHVNMSMLSSLSVRKQIVIDTSNCGQTSFSKLKLSVENGTYGIGQQFFVSIFSSYLLYVQPSTEGEYPKLRLNIVHSSGQYAYAELVGYSYGTKILRFEYVIESGDYTNTSSLLEKNGLSLNGSRILDGNGLDVHTTLPIETLNSTVHVASSPPSVIDLSVNTTDGEYGEGQVLQFAITFDQKVEVFGFPYLRLNVGDNSSMDSAVANFSFVSDDDLTIYFDYRVGPKQFTPSQENLTLSNAFILMTNITSNNTLIEYAANITSGSNRYYYREILFLSSSIRQKSTFPTQCANYSIDYALFEGFNTSYNIRINTVAPVLDTFYGLQPEETGEFYVGDELTFSLRFNKPIVVFGVGLAVLLDVGMENKFATAYYLDTGSDNQTIFFKYVVEEYVNTSSLNMKTGGNSLVLNSEDSAILRLATYPTTKANISTLLLDQSNFTLASQTNISLNGYPATVQSVLLTNTTPYNAAVLYPDSYLYFSVRFSAPVVSTCTPVLVLDLNTEREAVYYGGNGTSELFFSYQVQVGDYTNRSVQYRNRPNGLCPVSSCPTRTSCRILVDADTPTLPAFLKLSYSKEQSILLGTQSIDPYPQGRNTSISKIFCLQPAGEYGVGSVLEFYVEFTDEIIMSTTEYPQLRLSINRTATYDSGNFGKGILFRYITTENDLTGSSFLGIDSSGSTNSPIICNSTAGCTILNAVGHAADLNISLTPAADVNMSRIILDPTPPNISRIYLDFDASNNYTAGERIRVVVIPNKPVIVAGLLPRIPLAVGQSEKYAVYNDVESSLTMLLFDYQLSEGDSARNITLLGDGIDLLGGYAQILRQSTIPTTSMDVRFPDRSTFLLGQRTFILNALSVPQVTSVSFLINETKSINHVHRAGDIIRIQVSFSDYIFAYGNIYLLVNVGSRYAAAKWVGFRASQDQVANFTYTSDSTYLSNSTRTLIFEYSVNENDFTTNLDYVDISSLVLRLSETELMSYIRRDPSPQSIAANLTLPLPGLPGSLSYDRAIQVDGRRTYVKSLSFLNDVGVYSINTSILIQMMFSSPVLVIAESSSYPSILLETGLVDKPANYLNGSGTDTLLFEYLPEPGDMNDFLDYHADREEFGDSTKSFLFNGARIVTYSDQPYLDVSIWLNPIRGVLQGMTSVQGNEGVFQFLDSFITYSGPNYQLRFSAAIENSDLEFVESQILYNSFSSEQQLRPREAIKGEMVGQSVSLQKDIAVLGAPNFNVSTTTVQVVTISVAPYPPQREVQSVTTSIVGQPAIQSFYTTTNIDETVDGYFRIFSGSSGPTQLIPANANAQTLTAILAADLPLLGNVTASVVPYEYCACYNAYVWTLTFNDFQVGSFPGISTDGASLTSTGVIISDPITLQSPSQLAGTFTLSAYGLTTSNIPFDATASQMTSAMAELGLDVYDITTTPASTSLAQSWSITFEAYQDSYEIDLLTANKAGLTGGSSISVFTAVTQPGYHGPKGIAGYFQLTWRDETTQILYPNATAENVKAALENLAVINYVNVNRTLLDSTLGIYSWTVEFVSYNYKTERGYYLDSIKNVEPLVPINHLIATDAEIEVDAKWQLGSSNKIYSNARQGFFGEGAGGVFVYQRINRSWEEVAYLIGNDTKPGTRFGTSVSLNKNVLAVGAIGGSMDGRAEIQAIHCEASGGYFQLSFRGWSTDLIPHNVTSDELYSFIVADPTVLAKLYSITNIVIKDWGSGGLCDNNTAEITFYSPINGAPELFDGVDTGADLELLTVTDVSLFLYNETTIFNSTSNSTTNGTTSPVLINVYEVQKGTWRLDNTNADPQQIGAVYIFRSDTSSCDLNNRTVCLQTKWVQEAKLFPPVDSQRFSEFGQSVQLVDNMLVVGAPGSYSTSGAVYLFQYTTTSKSWALFQTLKNPLPTEFDRFGTSFSLYGTTLVIGTPGYSSSSGRVYVFFQTSVGGTFILAQVLSLPATSLSDSLLAQQSVIKFGYSVSLDQNDLVIGAPSFCDTTIYVSRTTPAYCRQESGAVFVYKRASIGSNYIYREQLLPSNIKEGDAFGHRVTIENNLVLVSAFEEYLGTHNASKVVMTIETASTYGVNTTRLNGTFKLRWKSANSTDNRQTTNSSLVRDAALTTRAIPFDATALQMQSILETDLGTQQLIVSRSRVNLFTGGYAWSVTFLQNRQNVSLFVPDIRGLKGTKANVTVRFINQVPVEHRSKVHLFKRPSKSASFEEELFLSPVVHQPTDLCGQDIALSRSYALVGCPNRDQSAYPGQNTGVGFIYDLSLLEVRFSNSSSSVHEGSKSVIGVSRDPTRIPDGSYFTGYTDVPYYLQSLDRNAIYSMQEFIEDLYDVHNGSLSETFPPQTMLDYVGLVGQAHARTQFYGNLTLETSNWLDGRHDYRGLSDYLPFFAAQAVFAESNAPDDSMTQQFVTNADHIDETPRENVSFIIQVPGLWPSILGHYYHHVTIEDQDEVIVSENGVYINAQQASYRKVVDDVRPATTDSSDYERISEHEDFGRVIGVDKDYGVMFVAAPMASVNGQLEAGKVVQYLLYANRSAAGSGPGPDSGLSIGQVPQNIFVSPSTDTNAKAFGNALAVHTSYFSFKGVLADSLSLFSGNISVLAVGQAALNTVYLYCTSSVSAYAEKAFTPMATLNLPEAYMQVHRFGYAVAFIGSTLLVTAPGLESVYLYHRYFNETGAAFQESIGILDNYQSYVYYNSLPDEILRSSDYVYDILFGDQVTLHRQGFGSAIAVANRHIVITAPYASYDFLGAPGLVQDYNTEGVDILAVGRGKAYVFYNPPPVVRLCLTATQQLQHGEFYISYDFDNLTRTTDAIPYNVSADMLQTILTSQLQHVGEVSIRSYMGYVRGSALDGVVDVSSGVADDFQSREYTTFSDSSSSFRGENTQPAADVSTYTRYQRCWDIALLSAYHSMGRFSVSYLNRTVCHKISGDNVFNDTSCVQPFDLPASFNSEFNSSYFALSTVRGLGSWQEFQTLTATNPQSGDLFGASVAIDEDYIVVGAPESNALTAVDWDFETGTLLGWTQTMGMAFRNQPTFGDNVRFHGEFNLRQDALEIFDDDRQNVAHLRNNKANSRTNRAQARTSIGKNSQGPYVHGRSSNLVGRYYISTYELRPGWSEDYTQPDPTFAAGNVQGASPTGVLTSDTFLIAGDSISFLLGGGCDIYHVYVELVVDGQAVSRQSAKCDSRMQRTQFSTEQYRQRAGQLRIVDNSTVEPWGYISVDDFRFDWDVRGASLDSSTRRAPSKDKVAQQAPIISPQVGVAYLFRRVFTGLWDNMPKNKMNKKESLLQSNATWQFDELYSTSCNESVYFFDPVTQFNFSDLCNWQPVERLLASDTRDMTMHFGAQVAVNAKAGVVVVSAPRSMRFNAYKDSLTNHPYVNQTHSMTSNAAGLRYPLVAPSSSLFKTTGDPGYFELNNNVARATWLLMSTGPMNGVHHQYSPSLDAQSNENPDLRYYSEAGGIYFYKRMHAIVADNGQAALVEAWPKTETVKFQASDTFARDALGSALMLAGREGEMLFIGSPGQDQGGVRVDSGAVYYINTQFLQLRFTQVTIMVRKSIRDYFYADAVHHTGSIYCRRERLPPVRNAYPDPRSVARHSSIGC